MEEKRLKELLTKVLEFEFEDLDGQDPQEWATETFGITQEEFEDLLVDVYDYDYTYEHLKVACAIQDYFITHRHEPKEDIAYEDIAKMTIRIYNAHKKEINELSLEEYGYIQAFAFRYLEEYFEGERK